jgi:hypothetical protein
LITPEKLAGFIKIILRKYMRRSNTSSFLQVAV